MFEIFHCQWWDSNRGSLVSEATSLPTVPQPRPIYYFIYPNLVEQFLHLMWSLSTLQFIPVCLSLFQLFYKHSLSLSLSHKGAMTFSHQLSLSLSNQSAATKRLSLVFVLEAVEGGKKNFVIKENIRERHHNIERFEPHTLPALSLFTCSISLTHWDPFSLFLSLPLFRCLSVSVSLSIYTYLLLSLSHICLSLFLCLSITISVFLSKSLSLSLASKFHFYVSLCLLITS